VQWRQFDQDKFSKTPDFLTISVARFFPCAPRRVITSYTLSEYRVRCLGEGHGGATVTFTCVMFRGRPYSVQGLPYLPCAKCTERQGTGHAGLVFAAIAEAWQLLFLVFPYPLTDLVHRALLSFVGSRPPHLANQHEQQHRRGRVSAFRIGVCGPGLPSLLTI